MNNSRSRNAALNILIGYIAQLGILGLTFIGRKIFLLYLSIDYLGVNGLYTNILTILSLAELGLDASLVYSLYGPVAKNDIPLISSILRYFKRIYVLLAFSILGIGLCFLPLLPYIINSSLNQLELELYYVLFLVNTVCSYFAAHKVALLSAYQENRIQKIASLITNLVLQTLYMITLYLFRSYFIYLTMTILTTVANNVILGAFCNHRHKEIKNNTVFVSFDKKTIIQRIKSTFLYKFGAAAINNTDNILISVIVSTAAVGLYSNYCSIISAIQNFIGIITVSLISGIGNLATSNNHKRQYEIFNILLFFFHYISALGFIGFTFLFNDVIELWLGNQYLLNTDTVFIISLNFYLTNAITPIWMYREANGYFTQVKYLMLIRAALNILFSVILGYYMGVSGILLATAVSLLMTSLWYEPQILFRNLFKKPCKYYWIKQCKFFLITMVSFLIVFFSIRNIENTLLALCFKVIIIVVIVSVCFIVLNLRTKEFTEIKRMILKK